ncbi:hypothetical protein SO802_003329 [Lithocarpus litseifolius]|uniref:Uncharacterized protein n=1 Tax=Lithocarpus litseifolius TaxID=425828 RepID=A0AAW2DZT9_9ROSI
MAHRSPYTPAGPGPWRIGCYYGHAQIGLSHPIPSKPKPNSYQSPLSSPPSQSTPSLVIKSAKPTLTSSTPYPTSLPLSFTEASSLNSKTSAAALPPLSPMLNSEAAAKSPTLKKRWAGPSDPTQAW